MKIVEIALAGLVLVALATPPASAQLGAENSLPEWLSVPPEDQAPLRDGRVLEAFGSGSQQTVFHAARFMPTVNTPNVGGLYAGYITPSTSGSSSYWTQLDLPNGAAIDRVYALVYDNDPSGQWGFAFAGYEAAVSSDANVTLFAIKTTEVTDTPGYTILDLWLNPPVVVRERTDINGDGIANVASYNLAMMGDQSTVGALRFWGAVVRWSRTVSPAPAQATFGDVPPSSSIFRFVEALADAGITGGCGGGNYCPDSPVTRGQMAVFLASALGLHWPN